MLIEKIRNAQNVAKFLVLINDIELPFDETLNLH